MGYKEAFNLLMREDKALEKATAKREEGIAKAREKFSTDPDKPQKMIANLMKQHVPEGEKIRTRRHATTLEAVSAAIPGKDPRRKMGADVLADYNKMINDPRLGKYKTEEIVLASYRRNLENKREDIHEYTHGLKAGAFRMFPALAPKVKELATQGAWEAEEPRGHYTPMAASFAAGAALTGLGELGKRGIGKTTMGKELLKKAGGKGMASWMGKRLAVSPHPYAKMVGFGLLAVPEFMAFEKVGNVIEKTEFAQENPKKAFLAELALGGFSAAVVGGTLSRLGKRTIKNVLAKNTLKDTLEAEVATAPTAENLTSLQKVGKEVKTAEKNIDDVTKELADKTTKELDKVSPKGKKEKKFSDIENTERVFEEIRAGKSAQEAIDKVGKEEILLQEASKIKKPQTIGKKTKEGLEGLGYKEEDFKDMTYQAARAIIKGGEKNIKTKVAEKEITKIVTAPPKVIVPKGKKSIVDLSEEERFKALREMSPQERFDLKEGGKVTAREIKKVNDSLRKEVEKGVEYKEYEKTLEEGISKEQYNITKEVGASEGGMKVAVKLNRMELMKVSSAKIAAKKGTASTEQEKIVEASMREDTNAVKKLIEGLVMASGLTTLGAILEPDEAEAGMADRILTKLTAKLVQGAEKKTVPNLLKSIEKAGLLPKASENPFAVGEAMKQVKVLPDLSVVMGRNDMNPALQAMATPYMTAHHYFSVNKSGMETFTNPMVQWASGQTAAKYNAKEGVEVFGRIMKDVKNFTSTTDDVITEMKPLMEKFYMPMQERAFHDKSAKYFKKIADAEMNKVLKAEKYGKKLDEGAFTAAEDFVGRYKFHKEHLDKTVTLFEEYNKAWLEKMQELAPKHSGVRMFLAAEDTAGYEAYPFLEGMLSHEEKVAVARIQEMMGTYAERIVEAGGKVFTKKPFIHHSSHPDANFNSLQKRISEINPYMDYTPPMAKLHSRAAGFKPMVPDIEHSMLRYLPDVNLRIEGMDFWRKKQKDGWHAFSESQIVQKIPGLSKFFQSFKEGFTPSQREGIDAWAEKVYALEVARLLAFSPSVTFKHGLKMATDLRIFGVEGAKSIPEAIGTFSRLELERVGGKEALKKTGISLNTMDDAVKAFTEQGDLWRTISDIAPFKGTESQWDKMIGKFNEFGGYPVAAIERYDRGFSTMVSLKMAAKKGMTPAQATYAVYDTIIKANFLSGNLNPSWLRNPKIRMMMIFQGTPFKLLEQRARLYQRGAKSVKEAGKVTLEQLNNLRKGVKEGEQAFKWGLIKGALTNQKDLFGTPITQQIMRELLLVGGAVGGGRAMFDMDLFHHFFHPPFIKLKTKEIAVGTSPIFNAAYETWMDKEEDDDEFVLSTFFKEWFGRSTKGYPVPANFRKVYRLSTDDIPDIYKGSEFQYIFGIPSLHD